MSEKTATEFVSKRANYIDKDVFNMNIAILSSLRSKDPNSQVGAAIVDSDHKIIGTGYNGLPRGMNDDTFNWSRDNPYLDSKYPYVCHGEMNAIANCNELLNLKDTTIYTTLFPCNECAKLIIQKGIKKVVYLNHKYEDNEKFIASKKMLDMCGVETVQYTKDIIIKQ